MRSSFQIQATEVANQFIDEYMTAASGEYVKVYLYILRHRDETLNVDTIADALNHTEADVRRAITYWKKQGVLVEDGEQAGEKGSDDAAAVTREAGRTQETGQTREAGWTREPGQTREAGRTQETGRTQEPGQTRKRSRAEPAEAISLAEKKIPRVRTFYTTEQVNRVAMDEDFGQLLYIAQKYMNKVFTPRDCELFAYLYDGLHMSMELLEFLVEYCVQGGHSNLRYLETVAINWHEKGIRTVEEAKMYVTSYNKDTFAVMKAFGLGDRNPGSMELDTIQRWFREYGFSKEIVVEACSRTLAAIHTPSFQYADKILSEWKKAGVRTMREISALDEKRESRAAAKPAVTPKTGKNQFHNFEQRDTNYDAMVLERLKQRLGEQ